MAKNWKWGHEKTSWKSLSESEDDVVWVNHQNKQVGRWPVLCTAVRYYGTTTSLRQLRQTNPAAPSTISTTRTQRDSMHAPHPWL